MVPPARRYWSRIYSAIMRLSVRHLLDLRREGLERDVAVAQARHAREMTDELL